MLTAFAGKWHEPQTPWNSGPNLSGLGILGLISTSVALLLMWALLTEPVQLTHAVYHGGSVAVARLLWTTMSELVVQLLAWI